MTIATLDSIAAAILAQLQTLLETAAPAGPLKQAVMYAGDSTRDRGTEAKSFGVTPAAMLAFESELPEGVVETAAQGVISTILRSTWRVFVIVNETRGHAEATNTVLECVAAVQGALTGLKITGLYQRERLRFVDVRAAYVKNGTYIYLARFSALAEQVSTTTSPTETTSEPLETVIGTINDVPVDPGDDGLTKIVTPDPIVAGQTYGFTVDGHVAAHHAQAGDTLSDMLVTWNAQLTEFGLFSSQTVVGSTVVFVSAIARTWTAAVLTTISGPANPYDSTIPITGFTADTT